MGIKGLKKLIQDVASAALVPYQPSSLRGKKIAIDASISLYQFLTAIQKDFHNENTNANSGASRHLTSSSGEVTSHLSGFLYRTIKLLRLGIQPIWVFEGKAPALKRSELARRNKVKIDAEHKLAEAQDANNESDISKYSMRSTRVTSEHVDQAIELLTLMGVPAIRAPGEAEAQCVHLCKLGIADAVASQDMDTLTLGAPRFVTGLTTSDFTAWANAHERDMNRKTTLTSAKSTTSSSLTPSASKISVASSTKKRKRDTPVGPAVGPFVSIHLDHLLSLLHIDMDAFIDLCILCGCDYMPTIKGVGPKRAWALIEKFYQDHDEAESDCEDDDAADADNADDEPNKSKNNKQKPSTNSNSNVMSLIVDHLIKAKKFIVEFPADSDITFAAKLANKSETTESSETAETMTVEEVKAKFLKLRDDVHALFKHPLIQDYKTTDFKWSGPNEEALIEFLVTKNSFHRERTLAQLQKLKNVSEDSKQKSVTSFFKVKPSVPSSTGGKKADIKKADIKL